MSTVAIASIAAAGIGAGTSLAASGAQANAANNAAGIDQQSLNFQEQEWATQQQNIQPWLQTGSAAENTLSSLTSTPGQGLLTPWTETFTPPTAAEAAATPGYQFAVSEGENALQRSAAASGGVLSTGATKDLTNYAENVASTNYQQQYNNALSQYQIAYNTFQNNQTNTFNRLSTMAGTGQQAATTLGQQGQAAAGNVTNIGVQTGNQLLNAGTATASGYVGAGNALSGGINGIAGALSLQQLLAQNNNSTFQPTTGPVAPPAITNADTPGGGTIGTYNFGDLAPYYG